MFQYTGMIGYSSMIDAKTIKDEIFGSEKTTQTSLNDIKSSSDKNKSCSKSRNIKREKI